MKSTEWVSLITLVLQKNEKFGVYVNYKKLNDVTKKNWYFISFYNELLE